MEERQRILVRFARALKLPVHATYEQICKEIEEQPKTVSVHPQDMREELDRLLAGELTLHERASPAP